MVRLNIQFVCIITLSLTISFPSQRTQEKNFSKVLFGAVLCGRSPHNTAPNNTFESYFFNKHTEIEDSFPIDNSALITAHKKARSAHKLTCRTSRTGE